MRALIQATLAGFAIGVLAASSGDGGAVSAQGRTYYVDAVAGSDAAAGTDPQSAWRSLDRVNATSFKPGDRLLFRAGGSWTGTLAPRGSGTSQQVIVVGRFGDGPRPGIHGAGATAAVLLRDQQFWEIADLEITNDAPEEGLRRGVLVVAEEPGRTLRHIVLRDLDVHDVRGKLGAEMAEKTTGGIGFEARGAGARFADLLVEGCVIRSVDNTGLYLWSASGTHPRDPQWPESHHTGVRIRNNRLSDIGKNAIVIRAALAPVIEHNVVQGAAARLHGNAIFVFGCKDAVMQFNEVYGTRFYGLEGAAFDSDYNSEGTIVQYNYSHDNGGGMVNLCNNPESTPPRGFNDGTIVRHNISQNETDRVIAFDGPVTNTRIYNNTIYVGPGLAPRIIEFDTFGTSEGYATGAWFANNVIVNEGSGTYAWGGSRDVVFIANAFAGHHPPGEPADARKLTAGPCLVAPGTGGLGRDAVDGYKLSGASPCRDSGVTVPDPGEQDYWGTPLNDGRPDRGAHEAPPVSAVPARRDRAPGDWR